MQAEMSILNRNDKDIRSEDVVHIQRCRHPLDVNSQDIGIRSGYPGPFFSCIPRVHRLRRLHLRSLTFQPTALLLRLRLSSKALLGSLVQDLLFERGPLAGFCLADAFFVGPVFLVCAEDVVAPAEGGGEVIYECHVVEIVVVCSSPERDEVVQ